MKSPQRYSWVDLPFGTVQVVRGPSPDHPYIALANDEMELQLHVDEFRRQRHEYEFGG